MDKKKKLQSFIILAVLIILFVNFTIISGYILINSYGHMELNPGEHYIVNIPFKLFQEPVVSGKALINNGTPLQGIEVTIKDKKDNILGEDITDSDGEYIITLPKISDLTEYYVDIEYDNDSAIFLNLGNGSNNYEYSFEDMSYSKLNDDSIELIGEITNKDAIIENGRIKATLISCEDEEGDICKEIISTKTVYLDIDPLEVYLIPNEEDTIEFKWSMDDLEEGTYKIEVSMSFNGKERGSEANFIYITD